MSLRHHDLGNNESVATGYAPANVDGQKRYIALTRCESKTFKTKTGAEKWLAKRGYRPDGGRI